MSARGKDGRCPNCRKRFSGYDDIILVVVNPDAEPYFETNTTLLCWKCAQRHEVETGQIALGETPIAS